MQDSRLKNICRDLHRVDRVEIIALPRAHFWTARCENRQYARLLFARRKKTSAAFSVMIVSEVMLRFLSELINFEPFRIHVRCYSSKFEVGNLQLRRAQYLRSKRFFKIKTAAVDLR